MKQILIYIFLIMACISKFASADSTTPDICYPTNGSAPSFIFDVSATLTDAQNKAGASTQISKSWQNYVNVTCNCPGGATTNPNDIQSVLSSQPVVERDGPWQYVYINDYLIGAAKTHDDGTGQDMYLPVEYYKINATLICNGVDVHNAGFVLSLKITKPFIGTVNISAPQAYTAYLGDTYSYPFNTPIYYMGYTGTITVPESCTIDAGQIVTIDFGNIWSGKFTAKGKKPEGVNPVTKQISVKCNSGVDAMADLTIRFESTPDASYPDAISSDNPDVGVMITDSIDRAILPNTGLIPFSLENGQARVTFKAYPVSTTGKAPAEGKFTSLAYIRIDFA
ncbi:fimbrial protein [Enterobacter quasiroggenkampii]|uniref:fimbrial protein n=1 Tax=Enterobacter quasiroggenkampii TaxID=2497436 RepID=UPI0021D23FE2|nr:fimbrial protein [Enterobacter quasiroggenkampii]MCU6306350.1 fimbrial protein [Enterobacter quasiroggenkampii]MCU6398430.1 fimbrial protein [Enterobacter quasiroggenkampii]